MIENIEFHAIERARHASQSHNDTIVNADTFLGDGRVSDDRRADGGRRRDRELLIGLRRRGRQATLLGLGGVVGGADLHPEVVDEKGLVHVELLRKN